jgi:hypothetical protein
LSSLLFLKAKKKKTKKQKNKKIKAKNKCEYRLSLRNSWYEGISENAKDFILLFILKNTHCVYWVCSGKQKQHYFFNMEKDLVEEV